jgi:hypothetical protein
MNVMKRLCLTMSVFFRVALLLIFAGSPVSAQFETRAMDSRQSVGVTSDIVIRESHISLLKTTLKLRPSQEPFWVPVESALYEMARWQATSLELTSGDQAISRSNAAVATRIKRIAAIAAPLIKALDADQRNNMLILARTAGLEELVAGYWH